MDDFRIQHSNAFDVVAQSTAPASGAWLDTSGSNNGTITVPTAPHVADADTKLLLNMDSEGSYFTPESGETMELISETFDAKIEPDEIKLVVFGEDTEEEGVTNEIDPTDITAYVSCDGADTQMTVTLTDKGEYESDKHILSGTVDSSAECTLTTDREMEYELSTSNDDIRIHGVGLSWE